MNDEIEKLIIQIKQETDIFAKAKLVNFLVREKDTRIIDIAKLLGKTSSYICHLLRLAILPDIIVDGYYSELISISHLFIISRIKDQKKLLEVYEELLKGNFTVQETDELVREVLYGTKNSGTHLKKDEILNAIENIKKNNKNISVKIIQTRIKGKLILEIKGNLEITSVTLRELLNKLG